MYEYDIIKMFHSVFDMDEYKLDILEKIINKLDLNYESKNYFITIKFIYIY